MATKLTIRKILLIVTFLTAQVFGWPQETRSQLQSNSGNNSLDSEIWCPSGVRAFAGYPSEDCPTPSHYYRCVEKQAFVEVCNNSEIYDPILNGCSKGGQQERRKRSLGKGSLKYDKTIIGVYRDKSCHYWWEEWLVQLHLVYFIRPSVEAPLDTSLSFRPSIHPFCYKICFPWFSS